MGCFVSEYNGFKVIEMEGSLTGTSSLMAMIPEKGLGMVILTNRHFAFDSLVKLKFQFFEYLIREVHQDKNSS